MATIDKNNCIPSSLRTDIMRCTMENKNLLSKKGSIYVGTGETISVGGTDILKTKVLEIGNNDNGKILRVVNNDLAYSDLPSCFDPKTNYSNLELRYDNFVSSTNYRNLQLAADNFVSSTNYSNLKLTNDNFVSGRDYPNLKLVEENEDDEYLRGRRISTISALRLEQSVTTGQLSFTSTQMRTGSSTIGTAYFLTEMCQHHIIISIPTLGKFSNVVLSFDVVLPFADPVEVITDLIYLWNYDVGTGSGDIRVDEDGWTDLYPTGISDKDLEILQIYCRFKYVNNTGSTQMDLTIAYPNPLNLTQVLYNTIEKESGFSITDTVVRI